MGRYVTAGYSSKEASLQFVVYDGESLQKQTLGVDLFNWRTQMRGCQVT